MLQHHKKVLLWDTRSASGEEVVIPRGLSNDWKMLSALAKARVGHDDYLVGPFKQGMTLHTVEKELANYSSQTGLRFGQFLMNTHGSCPCPEIYYETVTEIALEKIQSYM